MFKCRGCTGTCCTGVGSEPCTCSEEEISAKRRTPAEQAEAITAMSETICQLLTLCGSVVSAGVSSIKTGTPVDPD